MGGAGRRSRQCVCVSPAPRLLALRLVQVAAEVQVAARRVVRVSASGRRLPAYDTLVYYRLAAGGLLASRPPLYGLQDDTSWRSPGPPSRPTCSSTLCSYVNSVRRIIERGPRLYAHTTGCHQSPGCGSTSRSSRAEFFEPSLNIDQSLSHPWLSVRLLLCLLSPAFLASGPGLARRGHHERLPQSTAHYASWWRPTPRGSTRPLMAATSSARSYSQNCAPPTR